MRPDLLALSDQLKIDPETLILKDITHFKEEGVLERVQQIRFHHYNQKRMKHLEMIDRFFKQDGGEGHSVTSARGLAVPLTVPESLKLSHTSTTRHKERQK